MRITSLPARFHFVSFATFALLVLPTAGCDCASTPVEACSTSADCEPGFTCIDRICVPRADSGGGDGGMGSDAGPACVDVDRDGHFAVDATLCPTGDDCNDLDPAVHGGQPELCADGVDNDCNEGIDEPSCGCDVGQTVSCYSGALGTSGVGLCRPGIAVCTGVGMPGECRGERVPVAEDAPELCNFEDDDCDGQVDEGLRNACGACSTDPLVELCGDDVDNDCNGQADESCDCDYRCLCDPMTSCECTPPTDQPCYEGPFATDGQGQCRGGVRDCVVAGDTAEWQACEGQVLPGTECAGGTANEVDEDCDGLVDEGCRDSDGDGSPWPADCDDADAAVEPGATETCNMRDDNCNGVADEGATNRCGACGAVPAEVCGNGRDEDCDGAPDDGCTCEAGVMQDCFLGPPETDNVGRCRPGRQTCEGPSEFAEWGACTGGVGPIPEICNGEDDDCDGEADERWSAGSNACGFCNPTEICDDLDNDCDGRVDENVANRCGECGPEPIETCDGDDDDCDGTIDEGTTNSCGTCPPAPCYTETWDRPADCMDPGRTCDGVVEDMDHPGAITLGEGTLTFDYIYIAVTNMGQVAQLDTTTGAVNWIRSSHGQNPSRTSVAFDGSVWVGNRGFSDPSNIAISNLVHLDTAGNLVCRAAGATGLIRGVAIDAEGNVWAGAYNGRRVYRVSGTDVDTTTSPPTCRLMAAYDVPVNVYGLAVDPDGYVWTGSTPTIRIRIADGSQTSIAHSGYYGVAPDGAGRMWFGSWSSGGRMHSIDRTTLTETSTPIANAITGITVHPDGSVWGTAYGANRIEAYDPITGLQRCGVAIPSFAGDANPHGIAVDRTGRIWAPNRYGGYVNVYNSTTCTHIARYPVSPGQELYSYSDMTGHLLRTFTAPEGHWYQVFDSGYALAYWNEASWVADVPPDTSVEVTVRASDDPLDFTGSVVCGPFTSTPADLTGCALGRHRYLQLDVVLRSTRSGARPIVYRVDARWAY
jgi:streptogramin lyase